LARKVNTGLLVLLKEWFCEYAIVCG
jgi:hypothetical protein